MAGSRAAPFSPADLARHRQKYVLAGLGLTLVGLGLLGAELPTSPAALLRAIPVSAVGLLGLWIGGILLGNVLRPMWQPRAPRRAGLRAGAPPDAPPSATDR